MATSVPDGVQVDCSWACPCTCPAEHQASSCDSWLLLRNRILRVLPPSCHSVSVVNPGFAVAESSVSWESRQVTFTVPPVSWNV